MNEQDGRVILPFPCVDSSLLFKIPFVEAAFLSYRPSRTSVLTSPFAFSPNSPSPQLTSMGTMSAGKRQSWTLSPVVWLLHALSVPFHHSASHRTENHLPMMAQCSPTQRLWMRRLPKPSGAENYPLLQKMFQVNLAPLGTVWHWIRPTFYGWASRWLEMGHVACISGALSTSQTWSHPPTADMSSFVDCLSVTDNT